METRVGKQWFGPGEHCPSLDGLLADLDGQPGEALRSQAEEHLAGCPHCRTEVHLFREFETAAPRPEEREEVDYIVQRLRRNSPVPRNAWWTRYFDFRVWVPSAVALAALLVMVSRPGRDLSAPDLSGGTGLLRSGRITITAPESGLELAPAEFRWESVAGASSYTVHLFGVDHSELWTIRVSEPKAPVPAAVRRKLAGPKSAIWRVTAENSSGILADSGMVRFFVAR